MKIRLTIIIIASFLLFQGASPWEGSAAVAPNGELPITGFYIATNAFPKNTVVDITNIENGKKTRVIVSNTLTSPGLLAVVSREAAELIGMRAGSISRIRMIQPSDPMAYMRFTESMAKGTPEYDSGNVIDEEKLVEDVYKEDTFKAPDTASRPVERPATPPSAPGYIVDEPEWGGNGRLQIVDVPGFMIDQPPVTQMPPDNKIEKEIEEPLYITEHHDEDKDKELSTEMNEIHPKEEVVTPPKQEQPVLELVESPPNPPPSDGVYGIDPNDIISGITSVTPPKADDCINEYIGPPADMNPSIRTIDRLDRGKYYVQVAALSADLVESTLNQIDRSFAPVVFKGADNVYRILIGPLNQGESAAVLVRFKSIGYKDAFVRKGG